MKIAVLLLFSVLFCPCAWAAEEDLLPADQPFNQPVTLAVKGEALSDIMAMLSKQTGVRLRTTRDIADQKATIFVDKRPLKDVIAGLKTIFGYRFSAVPVGDSKVYELWESLSAKQAREAAMNGALGEAWKEIDRRIREVAGLSAEEQVKLRAELSLLKSRKQPGEDWTPEEIKESDTLRSKVGPGAVIARIYADLPPEIVSALRSGCTVYFDPDTTESEWRLPQSMLEDISAQAPDQVAQWKGLPDGGCHVSLRFRFQGNQLSAYFEASGRWSGSDGGQKMTISVGGSPGGEVTIGDVKPEVSETKLPNVPDNGTLEKQVAFTPKELADEADLYGQTEKSPSILVNRSDILSLLHKKLGLQSISDHHSYWFAWDATEPQTVKHLLAPLSEMIARSDQKAAAKYLRSPGDPKSDPVWGWDGSSLLMRERFPSELDVLETPNRVIRRLRANLAKNRYLDLDDVAELAALSDGQAGALTRNWQRLIYVRGIDYSTSEDHNTSSRLDPAVRFYSRLTDLQKRVVKANGLQVAALTQDQLGMLQKCVAPFLKDPQQKEQSVRRVGIWCNGTRLGKPESDGTMPVLAKLVRRESQKYDLRLPVDQGWVGHSISASSPADALKRLLESEPDAKNRPHFFGREMGYTMLFVFPDETTKEHPIELFEPVEESKEPASKTSQ